MTNISIKTKVLQYHLYQNPLYEFVGKNDTEINVVLLGFSNLSQKFLDNCLQMGQALSKKITVKVFSEENSTIEDYQKNRPALKDFFSINKIDTSKESYGNIIFDSLIVEPNEAGLKELFTEIVEKPHYIFIDFGDDLKNYQTAVACKKIIPNNAYISFVREKSDVEKKFVKGITPIFVNVNVKNSPLHNKIERRAFNVHLVWEKNLNVDYDKVKEEFLTPYNHNACIAVVLAIKYKLHEFGLNIDNLSESEIAESFLKLNFNPQERNEFIFVEHKRWVTEKICDGWKCRPIKECTDGLTKDEKNKLHACLVKSRADKLLEDKFPPEKWETLNKSEMSELDELDTVSVLLHRLFVNQAKLVKNELDLINTLIENIQVSLEIDSKIFTSFQEWKVCFKEICNGDKNKLRLYQNLTDILTDIFKQNIETSHAETFKSVKDKFDALDKKIAPILSAMKFWDYKKDDEAMVDNIPFILTYSENICLAIPFSCGEISELFGNVSAATIINPQKIIYLAFCKDLNTFNGLKKCIPNLMAYLNRKQLKAQVEFVIACADTDVDSKIETQNIKEIDSDRIEKVQFIQVKSVENPVPEIINAFRKVLKQQIKKYPSDFTALEVNSTAVSNWLQGAEVIMEYPSYSFDSANMSFVSINQCESFGYIRKKNFMTVNDLMALNNSFGKIGEQPTFLEDYIELWKKYKNNDGRDWKNLCDVLQNYSNENDVIATFSRKNKDKVPDSKLYTYFLPACCFKTVEKIIRTLIKEGSLMKSSSIRFLNLNSCEIKINDCLNQKKSYDKLFAIPYKLMLPEAIRFSPKNTNVDVLFDDLIVKNLNLNDKKYSQAIELIRFFQDKNYLTDVNLSCTEKSCEKIWNISFTYATREIKSLLTNAGKILEIYVYHEAKKTGIFDDVVTNFEPHWNENDDISNEFDCVLTKNFRMLIVECKAQNQIQQDVFFKLFGLVKKFGINATGVVVADTHQTPSNEMQKRRGKELKILTVQNDIEEIGNILSKIILDDDNFTT